MVRSQVAVDAALIAAGPRLQVIGRAGVGVDNVDLDAATRAGITVVNAPTGNTIAAAEHTIALLLALARRIPEADASIRRGEWERGAAPGRAAPRPDAGIVGLGKIGMAVAERARGLGMTLLGSDPYVTAEQAALRGVELVTFEELLKRSDAVTVHVPLTRSTTALLDAKSLARMKPGAFVLNVARGGIVDEAALATALREGSLGGRGDRRLRGRATDRLAAARRAEHGAHAAPWRLDRGGAGGGRRGDRGAGARRPRGPAGAVRGQRSPALRRGRADDRAVPAAGRDARPIPRPVRSRRASGRSPWSSPATSPGPSPAPLTAAALRGLLETGTTERVNLVNAGILAKARGIAVVERKTADAGGFSAAITVTGSVRGKDITVGGALAGGEMRLVRLNDYRLDMAAEALMLITRHRDRPGTIGRIGQLFGAADVNISAMHLARSAPRADALMILSVDDDVPPDLEAAICARTRACTTCGRSGSARRDERGAGSDSPERRRR